VPGTASVYTLWASTGGRMSAGLAAPDPPEDSFPSKLSL
jgi:hypothetical protein